MATRRAAGGTRGRTIMQDWALHLARAVFVLATLVALVVAVRSWVAEPFVVPTQSMDPAIAPGGMILGEKVTPALGACGTGDIVTFVDPTGSGETLVKRVVATGGQVVDIRDGVVWVDGSEEDGAPTVHGRSDPPEGPCTPSYPLTVPEGCVWVMGDNREESLDSRWFGPVSESCITSRVVLVW